MSKPSLQTPIRNWTTVELYTYPDSVYDDFLDEDCPVSVPGETYRLDESGLYVQMRGDTVYGTHGNHNLETMRGIYTGFLFDHHGLELEVSTPKVNGLEVKIAGWLSKIDMLGNAGADKVEYNSAYRRDREEYPMISYTWEEWLESQSSIPIW